MAAIDIVVNGETRQIPHEVSLEQLLHIFSLPDQRVAIELNGKVIRKTNWHQTVVRNRDKIEVVHFVGGG